MTIHDVRAEQKAESALRARLIAFYLPQFHPIPENDEWWGKGFTEWTNVAKANPLFRGHYQPRLPSELGFYDLRVPETRAAQAELAKQHGVEGFCYWHYWFAGKRLLERPFREVLASGEPDFPFCLAWANQSWTGIWHGAPERVLVEQTYPGVTDYESHFYNVLPAFEDQRYITVDEKPVFVLFAPQNLPHCRQFTDLWRELAMKAGLKGIHFIGVFHYRYRDTPDRLGLDAITISNQAKLLAIEARRKSRWTKRLTRFMHGGLHHVYSYREALNYFVEPKTGRAGYYPSIVSGWDNTPRSGRRGLVLHNASPELFRLHVREALQSVEKKPAEQRIVFVKSWNEWAEGNYLEPDARYGRSFLEVLRDESFAECHAVSQLGEAQTVVREGALT